jgi:hypothetical protein
MILVNPLTFNIDDIKKYAYSVEKVTAAIEKWLYGGRKVENPSD